MQRTPLNRGLAAALIAGGLLQLAPALSGIPPLVRRFTPRLAGVDRPGHLALTFDDGPHPDGTPAILDTLRDWRVSATFFLVAEQGRRYPDLVRRIVGEGHEVAVHGWNHAALPLVSPRSTRIQLRNATDVVADLAGTQPRWYRPPYGIASWPALAAAKHLQLQPIWWTKWGRDWDARATANGIARRVIPATGLSTSSHTVLLHDSDSYGHPGSWRRTNAALPVILNAFADAGVAIGSLREHGSPVCDAEASQNRRRSRHRLRVASPDPTCMCLACRIDGCRTDVVARGRSAPEQLHEERFRF
jgi:peptidoglycan/xylan/chitin deacetylase (PgdA/CDA1 family)